MINKGELVFTFLSISRAGTFYFFFVCKHNQYLAMRTSTDPFRVFISSLTLLATVALFFLPFLKISIAEGSQTEFYLFGLGLTGNDLPSRKIAWGLNIQYTLLCLTATSSFFILLTRGRTKLIFLSLAIFLITLLPVWMMTFTEGFLRPQVGSDIQITYSVAWIALALALGSATYSFLQMKEESYRLPTTRPIYLLDQE